MSEYELIALDTAVPQLRAPRTTDIGVLVSPRKDPGVYTYQYLVGATQSLAATLPASLAVGDLINVSAYNSASAKLGATWECLSIAASLPAGAVAGAVSAASGWKLHIANGASSYYSFGLNGDISADAYGDPSSGVVTLLVPSIYTTIQSAFSYLSDRRIIAGTTVKIQVADGTLTLSSSINASHPDGALINLIGNTATPDSCVIRGPNPPTFDALYVTDGNTLGLLDGFLFDLASKAAAANNYTGILSLNRSLITCGANIKVNNWYYGIAARNGSTVYCRSAEVDNAGDVGIWAFNGSFIDARSATSNNAVDAPNSLGFGIQAEYGSTVDCTGASATGCLIAGIAALSGSTVLASSATSSTNTGDGIQARTNSAIVAHDFTATGNTGFGINFFDETASITGSPLSLDGNTAGPIGPVTVVGDSNILANSIFSVAQFGTSYTNPSTGTYTLDRWRVRKSDGAGTAPSINVKQNTAVASTFGIAVPSVCELEITTVGAYGAAAFWLIEQPVANASLYRGKKVTFQFSISASTAITLTGRAEIADSAGQSNGATISSLSTTPKFFSVTRTVDSTATSLAAGISLFLGDISGTASIYIACTQLKESDYPTPVAIEADASAALIRCLPYAQRITADTNDPIGMASADSVNNARTVVNYYPKRVDPTITVSDATKFSFRAAAGAVAATSLSATSVNKTMAELNFATGAITAGSAGFMRANADAQYVDVKAEV
jgi:hypothetical protein